ncbi:MAG TPA: extracellular solute-binding protein, partial [Verrucomicrobiae bacterium]|nr:extracellular solute-binding protein [Verrucomicrobiae bacterium]
MRLLRWRFLLALGLAAALASFARAQESPDPKIVQAARKEGEVVWYTTMSADQSTSFMERFQRKYPYLKPSIIRLGGNALLSRITTEAKAGRTYFDVVHGTGEIVLPLMNMGLLASYVSPERKMIPEDLKDKKGFWTSVYVNSIVLGYNTNLTKGQPLPRSYEDLLQPRWKGRKISVDSTYATFLQGLISAWGKDKALDYLKKLAEQEPVVMRGSTVRAQLAAAGEFPLVIAYANIIQYLTEKGAPVDWLPLEPAVISVNTVMAGAKTSHPNAAKLFIDFTLSKEGQEKL